MFTKFGVLARDRKTDQRRNGGEGKDLYLAGTHGVLSSFNPPFSLILINHEVSKCWTRKGITDGDVIHTLGRGARF